jgi:tRNA (guanine37-N1)-methyltransferase
MIRFTVLTVFPNIIESYTTTSILGRAQKQEKLSIRVKNLRDWAKDKHHTVDDRVFGGGPGMLMKVEPLYNALNDLKAEAKKDGYRPYVLITTATGDLFSQTRAKGMASVEENIDYIIICGHYEGFDARVFNFVDDELTVGPYVLTGGELPALIAIDAVSRLLPSVLGNEQSAIDETTFTNVAGNIQVDGEHPQYTTPAEFSYVDEAGTTQVLTVPEILRSGHHKNIEKENLSQRVKRSLKTS